MRARPSYVGGKKPWTFAQNLELFTFKPEAANPPTQTDPYQAEDERRLEPVAPKA